MRRGSRKKFLMFQLGNAVPPDHLHLQDESDSPITSVGQVSLVVDLVICSALRGG